VADASTMASAVLAKSGERVVAGKTPLTTKESQTLSAAPTTVPTPALRESSARSSAAKRSLWLVGAGLIVLFAIGAWALRGPGAQTPIAAVPGTLAPLPAAQQAPASTSFALEIAASLPGAQVYEGETLLGATPLRVTIDSASVARAPRTFTIRKVGYAPYTVVQGASHTDAHVLAELSALPAPASPPSPTIKPRNAARPKAATSQKPKPANPPSDIFMQR